MKVGNIKLSKETSETLSKTAKWENGIQFLVAMNLKGVILLSLDDNLKNEFSEVESPKGLRYERKI